MDITLEQSLASAVRFILENDVNGVKPYFEDIPEAFYVPSVYFPVPYIESSKVTLGSYLNTIAFEVQIMDRKDWDAQARSAHLRDLIMINGLVLPLYSENGADTGKSVKVLEPVIRRIEQGIVSLQYRILDYFTPKKEKASKANNIYLIWNDIKEYFTQEVINGS